jgi:hypothetical protein
MGLALITGAEGRILTSICEDASREKIINNAKSKSSLLAYFFMV